MFFWNVTKQDTYGEIDIFGEIAEGGFWGDEVTPKGMKEELDKLSGVQEIRMHINSPGGDVFAGLAIYNLIRRTGIRTVAYIDGLAASAASVIAMAADEIRMPKNATLMIHRAWAAAQGNRDKFAEMIAELDRIDGQLAQIFADRTGKSTDEIMDLLRAETWMNADEAVENGFPVVIEENKRIAACADMEVLDRYEKVPDRVRKPEDEDPEEPVSSPEDNANADRGESEPVADSNNEPETADTSEAPDDTRLRAQRERFERMRKLTE